MTPEERILRRIFMVRAKLLANFVNNDLKRKLNESKIEVKNCPVPPENMAKLVSMIDISSEIEQIVKEELSKCQ